MLQCDNEIGSPVNRDDLGSIADKRDDQRSMQIYLKREFPFPIGSYPVHRSFFNNIDPGYRLALYIIHDSCYNSTFFIPSQ